MKSSVQAAVAESIRVQFFIALLVVGAIVYITLPSPEEKATNGACFRACQVQVDSAIEYDGFSAIEYLNKFNKCYNGCVEYSSK